MSYAEERAEERVAEQRAELTPHNETDDERAAREQAARELAIEEPGPVVQICELHGGYVMALLSQVADMDGPNLAAQVKVRTILAVARNGLGPQVATCLVAEYGLTPAEADELALELMTAPEGEALVSRHARETEAEAAENAERWDDPAAEHDRPRDEHGRFISEADAAREA
jgi:hypothetical protein